MTSPTTSSAILINDVVSECSLNDSRDSRDDKEKLVKQRNTPRNNFISYSNDDVNVRFRVRILFTQNPSKLHYVSFTFV